MTGQLTPTTPVNADGPATPMSVRLANRAGQLFIRRSDRGRRSFVQRAALIGTALAVNPFDFILRPQSAYAAVCGPANECSQGWTAFCCTINGGANTCPPGSYAAGWWKVSSSAFCRGEDRYVVDCNRTPGSSCSCRCADGPCDRRRTCCNNFRYGQCNLQVRGTTEVVCRIIICTPPWEWDSSCTTTVRTDERTREHSASCLPGTNPTEIELIYLDLGLVGSVLGTPVEEELAGPDGGSWREYRDGAIVRSVAHGIAVLTGPAGLLYSELDGPNGPLGYVSGDPVDVAGGQVLPTDTGAIYTLADQQVARAVYGPIDAAYNQAGGPEGWLGFPSSTVLDAPGGRQRVDFDAGWSLVRDPSTNEVRLFPVDVQMPSQAGEWPQTAAVTRWDGDNRITTAIRISKESRGDGARMAVVAAAGSFPDALSGGVLAGIEGGPVLLTGSDELAPATGEELRRLGVNRVVLVGGPSALSDRVERDLGDLLPDADVTRLSGESRFATAVAVSQAITDRDIPTALQGGDTGTDTGVTAVPVVYLTNGRDFPDALAASPAAARAGAPLLLCEPDQMPRATEDELRRLQPDRVVIVGGEAVVSQGVEGSVGRITDATIERVQGASRFDTAAAVVEQTHPDGADAVLVATGDAFADALAAGAAATSTDAALLLVATAQVPGISRRAIERLQPDLLIVTGGTAAVDETAFSQLGGIPTGDYTTRDTGSSDDSGSSDVPEPVTGP